MRGLLIFLVMIWSFSLSAFNFHDLNLVLNSGSPPFNYPLCIRTVSGTEINATPLLCFHGMGANSRIANTLATYPMIKDHVIGFDFPDHDICLGLGCPKFYSFGTIHELLPAIYMLKKIVIEGGADKVNLYGFSAGGGAVINTIATLNDNKYDVYLSSIGITCNHKIRILEAIQNGDIVLECPLKSVDEIIAFRGPFPHISTIGCQYRQWDLQPINSIEKLYGLNLKILLYFEESDEVLSNRDDEIYIQRLRKNNPFGNVVSIIQKSGGHHAYHPALWEAYPSFKNDLLKNTNISNFQNEFE